MNPIEYLKQLEDTLELSILETPVMKFRAQHNVLVSTYLQTDKLNRTWEHVTLEYVGVNPYV